jgi:outer membrane protein assembly factor BamE (lipoprotein component of BamABCDE complex)
MWLAAALCATLMAGCSPTVDHRGYMAKPGAFDQITSGMSKTEVVSILGSPSTTASAVVQGDSYYYITSITEGRAFLTPRETSREVIAIRFDRNDQVQSFAQYGMQDGRVIDMNSNKTAVLGEDTSLVKKLLRGAGGTTAGPMLGRRL